MISKRLLELEFKSNHSVKSKCLRLKKTANNIRYEKHSIKNKTDKNWERNWNNVLFRV